MTSTTIPSGAAAASAGVNATWTRTPHRHKSRCQRHRHGSVMAAGGATLGASVHADVLLPAPEPRDVRLVLRVRPPDLRRVHDPRSGRPALPGALREAAGRAARHRRSPAYG